MSPIESKKPFLKWQNTILKSMVKPSWLMLTHQLPYFGFCVTTSICLVLNLAVEWLNAVLALLIWMVMPLARAALDANKNLIGFHVTGGGIPENPIHANRFPAGAIDNYLADAWEIPSNITIGAFRAPRSNFNAAVEQSFLDEVAEAMGKDPIQLRLDLLKRAKENPVGKNNDYDASRYIGVLELLKEKSGWGKPENVNKKRGVAAYFCHASYAGHVVDIITRNGEPYVESVTSV
jgi:hypothetical protein